MIIIDHILYAEKIDFKKAGKSDNDIDVAISKKLRTLPAIKISGHGAKNFFPVEKLGGQWKELLWDLYGNPFDYMGKQPILNLVKADAKAEMYFKQFRYDDKMLPIKVVKKYSRAASWLNMLKELQEDRNFIKKTLNLSIPEFYLHAGELIKLEKQNGKNDLYTGAQQLPGDFASTYQRLMNKVSEYKLKGYDFIIDPMYGNKMAAKIGKTEEGYCEETAAKQEALIRKAARLHVNLDNVQVADMVNVIFTKNGWPAVSPQTVGNIIKKYQNLITPGRRGTKVYNNEVAMQVKRKAPQYPGYYWTLDGWTVELLYQDGGQYANRLVVVIVLDACNKYPVGFAIGERENAELIKQALRNAVLHMNDIFGDNYRPWQLQSDRYALKANTPFYTAAAHLHTPAAVGNAKSKIIEPYFKYLNKKYCQKQFNWSGFNVTASKKNQVNTEFLDKIKNSFPDKQGVIEQISKIILSERQLKIDSYESLWNQTPIADKVTLSQEDLLMVFGKEHTHLNSITGEGLVATLNGQQFTYDSFEPSFRALQYSSQFRIVYEEENLDHVLAITEDGKQRFLLHKKMAVAMDVKSTTPEMLEYRNRISQFNTKRKEEIIQHYIEDANIVDALIENTPLNLKDENELSLKLMLTYNGQQKERLQDAKGLAQIKKKQIASTIKEQKETTTNWQKMQQEFLQNRTDINQFLD